MSDIIILPQQKRRNYIFKNRPVPIHTNSGDRMMFPCLVMYHLDTGVPAGYPGFERWYLKLAEAEQQQNATLYKKASVMQVFLNYVLWKTNCDSIHELTINDIRNFLLEFRYTDDEGLRDPEEWNRGIAFIYDFLNVYYTYNKELPFRYHPVELIEAEIVRKNGSKRSFMSRKYNKFGVKPFPKIEKRNRMIPYDYLDMILQECIRHDPMIALGVACQAFAGLREGEVVNLTTDSIRIEYGGFGRIRGITLDLTQDAEFARNYSGTSEFGHIKKLRKQDVYTDFITKFLTLYEKHEALIPDKSSNALFRNKWGKPLSVTSYTGRVRVVFKNHFLPDLKQSCNEENWAKNAPYIESFEKEYPGAHAFRHWFTMYLLEKAKLDLYEVSHWRGDKEPTSMQDYVHVHAKMIDIYTESLFQFQNDLIRRTNE